MFTTSSSSRRTLRTRTSLLLAGAAALCFAAQAQAQVTLDFNFLPNVSGGTVLQGNSVSQYGFTVTDAGNNDRLYSLAPDDVTVGNYTGSVALFNNTGAGITTLTQDNGDPFRLSSIDIGNLLLQSFSGGGADVTFIGSVQGGGTVTQTFTHGANDNLETVVFGSDFDNLTSVSFAQSSPANQFDNIVVNTSVVVAATPEPGSVALLVGMSVTGAGFVMRRKRRRK
ncbi:MAG: hypothetical protein JWL77_6705 [Chthonomonadaceae bacterium]|nr:hypothetical protein [Chthonomonadaceae bacterium]